LWAVGTKVLNMSKLFIVDDDVLTSELLASAAEMLFAQIAVFNDARELLEQSLCGDDIILLDLQMPTLDGVETIRKLSQKNCQATLILMSGYDAGVLRSAEELAKDHGLTVAAILNKPIGIKKLTDLLSALLSKQNLNQSQNQNNPTKLPSPSITHDTCAPFTPTVDDLTRAIDEKQLLLYYQPQVDLKTNELSGVEALVRWIHPEHGMIYPDSFIPLAEHSGVIVRLTSAVIDMAVNQSALWQAQGRHIKISVNISAQNITSLLMPEQLKSLVKLNQLDPAMLMLEMTESALMGEITTSLDILTRLRLKGFALSIDDFGTGFSSLSQLHRIPFTELKVDQSFVMDMVNDPQSCAIVETCIMLGHKLNMAVVAEGIEDAQTLKRLQQLNCDIGQGYHFAKPLSPVDLIQWQANRGGVEGGGGVTLTK
ncbi:MAG: EAL domain-containing response regulator, partial [Psychrosphaera sp.]|nr:EAL domain-containing response regulator [Psychrosphaera sp.]